jgi:hypothetical protein
LKIDFKRIIPPFMREMAYSALAAEIDRIDWRTVADVAKAVKRALRRALGLPDQT